MAVSIPPPGRLVDIGNGRRLHVHAQGSGAPAVILEAGISASSLSWLRVQPGIAAFARVCSYDRAGLAWSDAARGPVTAMSCAADLHRLLTAIEEPGPYVFVGHSYGAFVLMAYAHDHPDNVAGIVLVDPIYPAEWLNLSRYERFRLRGGVFLSRVGALLARAGVVRACLSLLARGSPGVPRRVARLFGSEAATVMRRLVGEVQKLPPESWPAVQQHWSTPKCFTAMARHLAGLRASAAELMDRELPARIPVTIITAATQTPRNREEHARIVARSEGGKHLLAAGSGHWVHLDEPELVIGAVRETVESLRSRPLG